MSDPAIRHTAREELVRAVGEAIFAEVKKFPTPPPWSGTVAPLGATVEDVGRAALAAIDDELTVLRATEDDRIPKIRNLINRRRLMSQDRTERALIDRLLSILDSASLAPLAAQPHPFCDDGLGNLSRVPGTETCMHCGLKKHDEVHHATADRARAEREES